MRRARLISAAGGLLVAVLATGVVAASIGTERYEADLASSHVSVIGTSTLHDWHVEGRHVEGYVVAQEHKLAALWENSDLSAPLLALTVRVEIPVTSLTSGKRGMDEKMHEALKAKTHPMITYRLEAAEIATRQAAQEHGSGQSLTIETKGVLTVAGVEQPLNIPMHVKRLSESRLEISGDTSLRMTQFGIDPPRAMLGTLRTGDEVHVHWTWVLVRG